MLSRTRAPEQPKLFDTGHQLPNGLVYKPDFITLQEEEILIAYINNLPLEHAIYTVHTGGGGEDLEVEAQRRHFGFGWGWHRKEQKFIPGEPLPRFLIPLQRKIAKWLGIESSRVVEALINEYTPGAAIGWHVDNEGFEKIVGISLTGWCRMRFRSLRPKRNLPRAGVSRLSLRSEEGSAEANVISLELEPRSAYIMQGPVRWEWQHSVAKVPALRYSITFRTLPTQRFPTPER